METWLEIIEKHDFEDDIDQIIEEFIFPSSKIITDKDYDVLNHFGEIDRVE